MYVHHFFFFFFSLRMRIVSCTEVMQIIRSCGVGQRDKIDGGRGGGGGEIVCVSLCLKLYKTFFFFFFLQ